MSKNKKKKDTSYRVMTTRELLKRYLISKLPKQKRLLDDDRVPPENLPLLDSEISYLAIVLDGKVEDIMRAQNRLAALLLSGAEFVEFHPKHENVIVGQTKYLDGEFSNDVQK